LVKKEKKREKIKSEKRLYCSQLTKSYTYTSREWDSEINLYYYRTRYYDSKMGRYISQDPIGFEADVNFYRYVRNDPVRFTDPIVEDIVDWIPIVRAIRAYGFKPKGTHIWDYHEAAKLNNLDPVICEREIAVLATIYATISGVNPVAIGEAIVEDGIKEVVSIGIGYIFGKIKGAIIVGGIYFVDSLIMDYKKWKNYKDIYKTAKEAKKMWCRCKYEKANVNIVGNL